MIVLRVLAATLAVALATLLQVSVLSHVAWHGVVPNLVLLVVVEVLLVDAYAAMEPPADPADRSLAGRKEYDEAKRAAAQRIVHLYVAWGRPEAAEVARARYSVED